MATEEDFNGNGLAAHNESVAEVYYDADFRPAAESFIEQLEVLEKKNAMKKEPSLTRLSLYRQFDPLVHAAGEANALDGIVQGISSMTLANESMTAGKPSPKKGQVNFTPLKEMDERNHTMNESTVLMNFTTPMVNKADRHNSSGSFDSPDANNSISSDLKMNQHLVNALKNQELFFQEKLLVKDKEIFELTNQLEECKKQLDNQESINKLLIKVNNDLVAHLNQRIDNRNPELDEAETSCLN